MVSALRVWTGYAGWAPKELKDEIAQDAWFVVDATDSDVTTGETQRALARGIGATTGTLGWFANFPDDPALN